LTNCMNNNNKNTSFDILKCYLRYLQMLLLAPTSLHPIGMQKNDSSMYLLVLQCCSECSEPRMAQSLCTFCNKWLCFQCTDLHQHERVSTQPSDLQHQPRDPPSPSEIGKTSLFCLSVITFLF